MLDKEKPFESIDRLSKQLGDVFSMNFGNERVVVISRDRLFREAFLKDGHNFSGRPSLFVHESCWGKGHVINDGPETVELRRFFGNFIRQKLQGKSGKSLQEIVDEEVEQMIQRVDTNLAKGENQLDIEDAVFYAIGNVMTRLILGRSCPHGSEEFRQSAAWLKTTTELMERTAPLTFLPWLRYFPFKGFGYWEMKKQARKVNQMMMDDIKMRRQTKEYLDQSNNDLTTNLLRKIDEIKQNDLQKKDPSLKCYSDEMTARIMTEMFFAGIQTECGTFSWAFLYLVEFPDVQERLRGLIHKTFGQDGKVHWSERQKIPYLEATVMEVQRCANIAPFGIFHRNRQEAILDGYQIPKDSIILMNIWSTMRDFQLFPEPEKFNPERFLTKDGSEIDKDSLHGLYPYGIGPRICLGESIARCELFTVIGTLLQKYRFRKIPNVEYNMERKMQLIIQPDPYKLVIERVC
uniref:Cytochrome P450 n=1 Tax=Acrobeloides nanus TaxID=290746 RepID=A0A914DTF6_9BILA